MWILICQVTFEVSLLPHLPVYEMAECSISETKPAIQAQPQALFHALAYDHAEGREGVEGCSVSPSVQMDPMPRPDKHPIAESARV